VSDFSRREMIGASALALGLAGSLAEKAPAVQALPSLDSSPRRRTCLERWRFHLGHAADMEKDFGFGSDQRTFAKAGVAADAASPKFDDSAWSEVQVPHDWAVALPFAPPKTPPAKDRADSMASHGYKAIGREFPQNSIGWYRTPIAITSADRDRRIWLEFDGVFRDCLVFVNGYVAGRNESGYAPFSVEIGDFLDYDGGPNVVTVRADASLGEGWFYEGAGIYRHVDLVVANPVHIPQWGTFVRSEIRGGRAQLLVSTEILNSGPQLVEVLLKQQMFDARGRIVAECEDARLSLTPGQRLSSDGSTFVDAPSLWSVESPNLYTMISEVIVGSKLVDRIETRFGIRGIRFDAQRGFFLNGKPVKLLGTCNHQDHAGVGAGIPDELHRWRVAQLQEMGSNAWRSAHNPPAAALLNACDEMGMLMICEARINSSSEEGLSELERMVRRDRNRPCVILWSLGNEEPHQATARGARINADMAAHVKRLDPTRPTTFAMDQGWDKGIGRVVDVLGFNYRTNQIEAYHARHPEQPVYGSETGSTVATRGEYETDAARHIVRAYDTEHPWWATTAEEWWTIVADRPYIAGGFVWTGFDYRGEPTPYAEFPSISSQFGILDTCGFPKDDYYYYRAWWRPDQPLVHLLPHWNWPGRAGQMIEVWAHGNTDEVELLLNGQSLGRKAMPRNRHLEWKVPYAPGRLEAVGYNGGSVAARDLRETTGPAHEVTLVADRRMVSANGVVILNAAVVDAKGRVVPTAGNLLRFAVTGGTVIGVGNGNPNSIEPDAASERKVFNGFAQAILRVGKNPGPVDVTVASAGLRSARLRIAAL
jgi:beta-galactosidase